MRRRRKPEEPEEGGEGEKGGRRSNGIVAIANPRGGVSIMEPRKHISVVHSVKHIVHGFIAAKTQGGEQVSKHASLRLPSSVVGISKPASRKVSRLWACIEDLLSSCWNSLFSLPQLSSHPLQSSPLIPFSLPLSHLLLLISVVGNPKLKLAMMIPNFSSKV